MDVDQSSSPAPPFLDLTSCAFRDTDRAIAQQCLVQRFAPRLKEMMMATTNQEAALCMACSQEASGPGTITRHWRINEVAETKQRKFREVGFPSNGTVTVYGWKVHTVKDFPTHICARCIAAQEDKNVQKLERAKRVRKILFIIAGVLIVAGGMAALVIDNFDKYPGAIFTGAAAVSLAAALLSLGSDFRYTKERNKIAEDLFNEFLPREQQRRPEMLSGKLLSPPRSSSAQPGYRFGCDETRLAGRLPGGDWDIVHATWLMDGFGERETPYDDWLFRRFLSSRGYRHAGEFLDAGADGTFADTKR